ncbi:hypothetical protein [Curtobacterium sp. MCBD17_032]|uniref:hypothetical protein n=1 Tax=Curtobacterium sp. MCBD17_032 TaxID=2175659 RepID=UPI0015E88C9F|nr:hypothetical protein [Curtobacterium sp. MCBD17_032]
MKTPGDAGARQQPIALVAAVVAIVMGVLFPVLQIGDRVGGVLSVASEGVAGGILLVGGVFLACRAAVGGPVLVLSMLAVMFSSRQAGGVWLVLIPSHVLSAFGSATLGGHLRFLRARHLRRHQRRSAPSGATSEGP